MSAHIISLMMAILAALALATCDDGGSSDSGGPGREPLPAGEFTREVALSVETAVVTELVSSSIPFRHYQWLYKPADIGGSGPVASIFFRRSGATASPGITCPHVTIKLAHTDVENLGGAGTDMTLNIANKGSAVTVLDDGTYTIPAGDTGEYFEIPLEAGFDYNGVDNLVVDITRTAVCSGDQDLWSGRGSDSYTSRARSDDSGAPDTCSETAFFVPHVKFAFDGGDEIVVAGESTEDRYAPFSTETSYQKVQLLYLAGEIGGSGPITGIALLSDAEWTESETYTITVKMGHTDLSGLTTSFAANSNVGSPVTLADGIRFDVPAGLPRGSYIWLPLPDGAFTYNGTDNLVVEIMVSAASSGRFYVQNTGGTNRFLRGVPAAENGALSDVCYGVKFRFNGGTLDVITSGSGETANVFNTGTAGRLNLYRACELGSAGTITSIACRMFNGHSSAQSYAGYRVLIGHSGLDALQEEPASGNFVDRSTAFSGIVSVPAGLVKGDWIEIPLSRPFFYDGKRNLAVWLGTTGPSGAASDHVCVMSASSGTRYVNQTATGSPGAAVVSASDRKLDMRFRMSR